MDKKLAMKPHKDNSRLAPDHAQNITEDAIRKLLPKGTHMKVTDEVMKMIHNMEEDSGLPQELLEEDLMSYMYLVGNSKGNSVKDLVNAVKYCNLKRNYGNKEAWSIVFPERYNRLVDLNKQVDNHVSMYNSSKLVVAIDTEMLIPVSFTYSSHFHAAVKELYKIGVQGKGGKNTDGKEMTVTPMVRVQALKELTTITKPMEEQKVSLSVKPSEAAMSIQAEMNDQLKAIVAHQKSRIDAGDNVLDVQNIGISFDDIVEAEVS